MTTIIDTELKKCSGCGACINACPVNALVYSKDEFGFTYPAIIKEKCIECGKCVKICPKENEVDLHEPMEVYAASSNISKSLIRSSSGGIFPLLAEEILKLNGCVFGCTMDERKKVYHTKIEKINDICKIQKSKYVQSFMGEVYLSIKKELIENRWVLLCGTPCIVAGAKSFLSNIDTSKLLLVDLVCHGIPSQDFFDSYIKDLQKRVGKITEYEFRTKKTIDSGMSWLHSYRVENKKKRIIKNWPEDCYNYLYMNSYIYRESCYICQYTKTSRVGDITLCDYWNWKLYHNNFNENDAVSGVLVNTKQGQSFWNIINKYLTWQKTDIENIVNNNSCLKYPTSRPTNRDELLCFWKQNGFEPIRRKFEKEERITIWKNALYRLAPKSIKRIYSFRKKRG